MSGPDLSLKLLQALNDKDPTTVSECAKDKSVKEFIDNRVDVKQIENVIESLCKESQQVHFDSHRF